MKEETKGSKKYRSKAEINSNGMKDGSKRERKENI
jgi:hypothetical protein